MKAVKRDYIQPRLFQAIDTEAIIPEHHVLRRLKNIINFSCVHEWVEPLYSSKMGRPSIDPELLIRIMVLSYFFNHSERQLFDLLPMHAGYLWFCGLDFESTLPHRTTLVKTRSLWRENGLFEKLMHYVVDQCIAAGLVEPNVNASVDGTQVRANASIKSLQEFKLTPVQSMEDYLTELEQEDRQEKGEAQPQENEDDDNDTFPLQTEQPTDSSSPESVPSKDQANFCGQTFSNETHRSVSDPDARLYRKGKGKEAFLRYLVHNLIDVKSGVVLQTTASPATGTAERSISLAQLQQMSFRFPQIQIRTLSADKGYDSREYVSSLFDRNLIPLVSFRQMDLEEIPTWKRKTNNCEHQRKRHLKVSRVEALNRAKQIQIDGKYRSIQAKRVRTEHSFAEAKTVHGLGRARSRGLDCMQEQSFCTAIAQNLKRLCRWKGTSPYTVQYAKKKMEALLGHSKTQNLLFFLQTSLFRKKTPVN